MLMNNVTLTIKNGLLQKQDKDYFGCSCVKIVNISKVVVAGYRVIEFYLKDDDLPAMIFVYGDNTTQCVDDYTFIRNELKTSYEIKEFFSGYFCGFEIINKNIIEPGPFLVEGFIVDDEKEAKVYREPINVKDIVAFKHIGSKTIELTLKKDDLYWIFQDKKSADDKALEINERAMKC